MHEAKPAATVQVPTGPTGPPGPTGDLTLTPERWAVIAPKLEALLAELAKLEALETLAGWESEPDTADAWGATATRAGSGAIGER